MVVAFDYDAAPRRCRLGMQVARAHARANLYEQAARTLSEVGAELVCTSPAVPSTW